MESIPWRNFNPTSLQEARTAGRPILLVVTTSWCNHCRELEETTLRAPEVARKIEEGFLPIKVDAERRPDVNQRFGTGSWPTIAWLTPGAELIANAGFLSAEELCAKMERVKELLASKGGAIEDGIRALLEGRSDDGGSQGQLRKEMVDDVVDAIYERFDHRYGGWGEGAKFPHSEALDFAMVQVSKRNDDRMREVVTLTLDRMMEGGLHDPIDGGFFRFSKTPDWSNPNLEKILGANSNRLRCYLEAYQLFDNPGYRAAAEGIVRWMLEFMKDPETGAFFGSQDAEPDYYVLDEEGRKRRKPPHLDQTIYTNWNAMAVSSLLKASVVLERPELRSEAMAALGFVLENLFVRKQGLFHYWDGTYHLPGMLSDQAYMIRALVDASQHSGNADLLLPAERIAEQAIANHKAPGGGFYDILRDPAMRGSMQRRNRSILENSVMAEALVRLGYLSRRPEFHQEAISTLEAFSRDYKEYGYYVAGYGRAVDLVFYEPLFVTVVGDRDSAEADRLRMAALSRYVPSRIVQMLDPAHDPILIGRSGYQVEKTPIAYVSVGKQDRAAVKDPAELVEQIDSIERERRSAVD